MESRFQLRHLSLLAEACRDNGVFSVVGHGIPSDIFRDTQELASCFFSLPSQEKLQLLTSTSLGRKKKLQYKETASGETLLINCTPEEVFEETWPTQGNLFCTIADYLGQQLDLYDSLIPLVIKSLDDGENMLSRIWSNPTTSMTIRYYHSPSPHSMLPKFDEDRISSIFTTTFLGKSRELQVFTKGRWLNFSFSNEDGILVSVGDQLQRFSRGKNKTGVHRIFTSDTSRQMFIHVSFCALEAVTKDAEASIPGLNKSLEDLGTVPSNLEAYPGGLEQLPIVSSGLDANETGLETVRTGTPARKN